MNVLGLLTRGYLGGGRTVRVLGPSPDIVSAESDMPDISGSVKEIEAKPALVGSSRSRPTIRTSGSQVDGPGDTPSITGSLEDSPSIRKK